MAKYTKEDQHDIDAVIEIAARQEKEFNERFARLEKLIASLLPAQPEAVTAPAEPPAPPPPKAPAPRKPRKNGRFWLAMAIYLRHRNITAAELHKRIVKPGGYRFSETVLERTLNAIREIDDCLSDHGVNIRASQRKA